MQSSQQFKDSRYEGVEYLLKTLDKAGISIDFEEKQCSSHEEGVYLLDKRKIIFAEDKPSVHVLKRLSWHVLQHCRMWKHDDTKSITYHPWGEAFEDFINTSGIDGNKLTGIYKELGVDPSEIVILIEAEAAATFYYPEQIAALINRCLDKNETLKKDDNTDKK